MRFLQSAMLGWLMLGSTAAPAQHEAHPTLLNLAVSGEAQPLAVSDAQPRFTWSYAGDLPRGTVQTAARVLVATGEQALRSHSGQLWDSGWVSGGELAMIYRGPKLKPGHVYSWRVESENRNGLDLHSMPARFRTADDAWAAKWIAAPWSTERDGAEEDGSRPMPVFRRQFLLRDKPTQAVLRIAGLGQWQAKLSHAGHSQPAQAAGLHGAWTDYRKSVAYETTDITSLVGPGANVLTILLGNGMYNVQRTPLPGKPHERYTKFVGSFGPPRLIAEVDVRYADGRTERIGADTQWSVMRGPVVFDSTYGGEDYDARREPTQNPEGWTAAKVVDGPGGALRPQRSPPVGQHERYRPVKQTDLGNGRTVYDLGQNFAGVAQISVKGPAGAILRLTPGELLNPDGTVSQATFHGPLWWSYTLRGDTDAETWAPFFGYSGFRYVQAEWTQGPGMAAAYLAGPPLRGKLLSLVGVAQHSDAESTGTFASSSEMLNRIHALIVAAMHNNEVSLLTDCPHREKLGWLEQTHLVAPGLMFNNDLKTLFEQQDRNMEDAQWADGIVPTIAPEYTRFGPKYAIYDDSPEWGSASILEPWWAYRFYRDPTELARDYPMMQRYLNALASRAKDGIVAYGLGDWYDIGPGGPGFEKNTSLGVTATLMLFEDASAMQRIADLLGYTNDAIQYGGLAARTAQAFNRRFWDAEHGWYDRGSQTANAMPLALGIVPEEHKAQVLAHLVADIHAHNDHTTAGEIGYPYLLRALADADRDDIVLAMLLRKDPPSYGSQLAAGATALTEAWDADPHSSQDHFMLGSAEEWLYRRLGGLDLDFSRTDPAARITVRPIAVAAVDWVNTSFKSIDGTVESDWKRTHAGVHYTVTIPGGVEATILLPVNAVASNPQMKPVAHGPKETRFLVGPGTWSFHAQS